MFNKSFIVLDVMAYYIIWTKNSQKSYFSKIMKQTIWTHVPGLPETSLLTFSRAQLLREHFIINDVTFKNFDFVIKIIIVLSN